MSIAPELLPDQQAIRAASDARLQTVFPTPRMVWIVDEQYDPLGPILRVTLVCPGEQGRWMRCRYCYDIPSDTLYVAGSQPLSEAELAHARRNGRRL